MLYYDIESPILACMSIVLLYLPVYFPSPQNLIARFQANGKRVIPNGYNVPISLGTIIL